MLNAPKIMVVDDDEGVRITLTEILAVEGFDVVAVSDGFQGVEVAAQTQFDLILMDFRMPGIDGLETYRHIKVFSPKTVVIMITGHPGGLVEEVLNEGAYGVLYKPFDIGHLTEVVRTVLRAAPIHKGKRN